MKTKSNKKGDIYVPAKYDACQTPDYALGPLLPYIKEDWIIWESARGEGLLADAMPYENTVVATDLLDGEPFNFFTYSPVFWDVQITNVPFSLKFPWLLRSYELGKPFALLLPVETLGASSAQGLLKKYGFEIMLLDSRVDFKMPNVGWTGKGAQFPVMWLCWNFLPEKVMFGEIRETKKEFKKSMNEKIQRRENSTLVLSGLGGGPSSDKEEDKSEGESLVFDW